MKKTVLFDWDRTIADIEGPTDKLLEKTFSRLWDIESYPDFIKTFRLAENQWRKVLDRLVDILWTKTWEYYYEIFKSLKENWKMQVDSFEWIKEQIIELSRLKNTVLGLVTNKNLSDIKNESISDLLDLFDLLLWWDDIESDKLKPSWFMIDELVDMIWEKTEKVIMIWDSSNDLNALWNSKASYEKIWVLATWWIQDEEKRVQLSRVDKSKLDHLIQVEKTRKLNQKIRSHL